MKKLIAGFLTAIMTLVMFAGPALASHPLKNYPSFLTSNNMLDAIIVVGATAKTEDVVGAADIAVRLGGYVVGGAAGTVPTPTAVAADSVEVSTPTDKTTLDRTLGSVRSTFTAGDLSILKGGQVSTASATTNYNQFLRLRGANSSDFDSGQIIYGENRDPDRVIGDFAFFGNLNVTWEYNMNFDQGLQSKFVSTTSLDDFKTKVINILGRDYTLVSGTASGGSAQTGGDKSVKLVLLSGAVIDTLAEGQSKTYTMPDGTKVDITVDFVDSSSASFTVNGVKSTKLAEGVTDVLAGIRLGVIQLFSQQFQGGVRSVQFSLGANKLELTDNDYTDGLLNPSGGVRVDDKDVNDVDAVKIDATVSGGILKISDIRVRNKAQAAIGGDVFVKPGQTYRSQLLKPESQLHNGWDIMYKGLVASGEATVQLVGSTNEVDLIFKTLDGQSYNVPILDNRLGNFIVGRDVTPPQILWFIEGYINESSLNASMQRFKINSTDYFVVTNFGDSNHPGGNRDSFTRIFQYNSIDTTTRVITLTDLSGTTQSVTYQAVPSIGNAGHINGTQGKSTSFVAGGRTYIIYVENITETGSGASIARLAIDLNGDGKIIGDLNSNGVLGDIGVNITESVVSGVLRNITADNSTILGPAGGIPSEDITQRADIVIQGGGIIGLGRFTRASAISTSNPEGIIWIINKFNASGAAASSRVKFNLTVRTESRNFNKPPTLDEVLSMSFLNPTTRSNGVDLTINTPQNTVLSAGGTSGAALHTLTQVAAATVSRGMTIYGVFVELLTPTSSTTSSSVNLKYPFSQRIGSLLIMKAGAVVGGAVAPGAGAQVTTAVTFLDTEVTNAIGSSKHIISVGGPAVNSVSAKALGVPFPSFGAASTIPEGAAIIKVVDNVYAPGRVVVVVAGFEAAETRLASSVLQQFDTKLAGQGSSAVKVSGTNVATATITAV